MPAAVRAKASPSHCTGAIAFGGEASQKICGTVNYGAAKCNERGQHKPTA